MLCFFQSMNGCEVNARVTSKGDVFDLPTESTSVILIKGSNEDHRILFHPNPVHHSFSKEPPAKKRKFLESNLDIPGKIHESESQMLLKQVVRVLYTFSKKKVLINVYVWT